MSKKSFSQITRQQLCESAPYFRKLSPKEFDELCDVERALRFGVGQYARRWPKKVPGRPSKRNAARRDQIRYDAESRRLRFEPVGMEQASADWLDSQQAAARDLLPMSNAAETDALQKQAAGVFPNVASTASRAGLSPNGPEDDLIRQLDCSGVAEKVRERAVLGGRMRQGKLSSGARNGRKG